ncbi:unnamed protein product, partial [Oppiella nova]
MNGSRLLPFFQRPSLISIVRFPNEECFDSSNQTGTCYTPLECKKLGGVPSSPCARGLGACCIVSRSCHNTTYNKVVYFKNPSYPLSDTQANFCDLTVNIYDTDVCQLRLDFMDFQLDQPTQGNCLGDKFRISSSGFAPLSVPVICGLNRNQHMYISLPRDLPERSASVVFETNSVGDYRWHVRITQIDCNFRNKKNLLSDRNSRQFGFGSGLGSNTPYIPFLPRAHPPYSLPAPMGCLQYFTQPSGTIESFNFGEYLNNMDYGICIERLPNTCRVTFTASDFVWSMDSSQPNKERSGVGDNVCDNDYLLIPAASQRGDAPTFDRYCGGRLHYQSDMLNDAPVVTKANGPIVLRFHSDPFQLAADYKDGFRLRYEQNSRQFGFGSGLGSNTPYIPFLPRAHPPYSLPAPMGCLQYFTQTSGTIESFNFGEYLNNMDYGICIERQPNTCRVTFTASDFVWSMDSTQPNKERSGVGDNVCDNDYLLIPAASQRGDAPTYDRYCGGRLHYQSDMLNDAPVVTKANGPIVLRFHSDPFQLAADYKDGFRLRYE